MNIVCAVSSRGISGAARQGEGSMKDQSLNSGAELDMLYRVFHHASLWS